MLNGKPQKSRQQIIAELDRRKRTAETELQCLNFWLNCINQSEGFGHTDFAAGLQMAKSVNMQFIDKGKDHTKDQDCRDTLALIESIQQFLSEE